MPYTRKMSKKKNVSLIINSTFFEGKKKNTQYFIYAADYFKLTFSFQVCFSPPRTAPPWLHWAPSQKVNIISFYFFYMAF
ncbi:hypothetical protein FKM82_002524 [Ascaphus truei]